MTGSEFTSHILRDPDFCKSIKEKLSITSKVSLSNSAITALSPHLRFQRNASFNFCKNLTKLEGHFCKEANFSRSNIQEIGEFSANGEVILEECKALHHLSGKFKSTLHLHNTDIHSFDPNFNFKTLITLPTKQTLEALSQHLNPKMEGEITNNEFFVLLHKDPSCFKKLSKPLTVTQDIHLSGHPITHLSRFLTFTGKSREDWYSLYATGCKALETLTGKFHHGVSMFNTPIKNLENLEILSPARKGFHLILEESGHLKSLENWDFACQLSGYENLLKQEKERRTKITRQLKTLKTKELPFL
jgi:hypothetical protein